MNYNVILEQNGVTKIALFNIDSKKTIEQIREFRNNPIYKGFNIRVEDHLDFISNTICPHDNIIESSVCCGEESIHTNESDLCPRCKEHTGFTKYCVDCNIEL